MVDFSSKKSHDQYVLHINIFIRVLTNFARPWRVVACGDPNDERHFTVPRHILCISPVLKGYFEEPDTTPPGLQRYGAGTLALNNEGDVVKAMLDFLKKARSGDLTLQSSNRGAAFFVRLYKLALSLGYDTCLAPIAHGSSCRRLENLCTTAFDILRSKSQQIDDFTKIALEASQWGLINEQRFRHWFITYVSQRRDELLGILTGDDDATRFCKILVSALALTKDDCDERDPSTPQNMFPTPPISASQKRRSDLGVNSRKRIGSQSPLKGKETVSSSAKKRKLNAFVEDASESD
jgi:hypothetical protein